MPRHPHKSRERAAKARGSGTATQVYAGTMTSSSCPIFKASRVAAQCDSPCTERCSIPRPCNSPSRVSKRSTEERPNPMRTRAYRAKVACADGRFEIQRPTPSKSLLPQTLCLSALLAKNTIQQYPYFLNLLSIQDKGHDRIDQCTKTYAKDQSHGRTESTMNSRKEDDRSRHDQSGHERSYQMGVKPAKRDPCDAERKIQSRKD